MTRLFIGLDLPDYIKQQIINIQNDLLARNLFEGVMIQPQQLHLTLKYIGQVPTQQIPYIENALRAIQFNKIVATLGQIGVFEDDGIRVLYQGVDCPVLDILVDALESALESWCKYDNQPFVAHITLFKVAQVHDKHAFLDYVQTYKENQLSFEINEFLLKKVTNNSDVLLYDTLSVYALY